MGYAYNESLLYTTGRFQRIAHWIWLVVTMTSPMGRRCINARGLPFVLGCSLAVYLTPTR